MPLAIRLILVLGGIAIVSLIAPLRDVHAQQSCTAPGGGDGGAGVGRVGASGASSTASGIESGGSVSTNNNGATTSATAEPGSTPFLMREFALEQQRRAQNLMGVQFGRSMPMFQTTRSASSRLTATRVRGRRRLRRDESSLDRRRQIALDLSRERQDDGDASQTNATDSEPDVVQADAADIPEMFRR